MKALETMHLIRDVLRDVGCRVEVIGYSNVKRVEEGRNEITEQGWTLVIEGHNGAPMTRTLSFVYDHKDRDNEELLDIKRNPIDADLTVHMVKLNKV